MLNEHYDVTTAAYAVGYESLSHFRREYLRILLFSKVFLLKENQPLLQTH